MPLQRRSEVGRPLFCKLLDDPGFVPSLRTLIGLNFVEGFPMATQKLAVYFLNLILYAIWHFRKMKRYEKVACTSQNAISLVEFSFKQTCSRKFEFWRWELKLNKFKKHWSIGGPSAGLAVWTIWFLLFPDVICL